MRMRRSLSPMLLLAIVAAACTSGGDADPAPTTAALTPTAAAPTTTAPPPPETAPPSTAASVAGIAAPPVQSPVADEIIYFVMTDRFANGDPGNDTGGIAPAAGPLVHGFLPADDGYYHGGDLAGLTDRLDYIAGLGVTAIWITPPFANRTVQGNGTIAGSTAGYHGYWQVDFTRVDPHLGTDDDLRALVAAAHERGLKVFLDAVTNHTGDVITYAEGQFSYKGKEANPYRTAAGEPFDDADFAGGGEFPELDPSVSFPYRPVFTDPADADAKEPDFLDDVTNYHNRGNSTFTGENSLYGDFFGLDDLFTEKPEVVDGMIGIYTAAIDEFGIDGFRVDTAKHVNDEFWEAWVPAILDHAATAGKDEFYVFGEVFGESSAFRSRYTTVLPFPAVLDFGFHNTVFEWTASASPATVMAAAFEDDDFYTDADSNAAMLPKFAGNHDIGRLGLRIRQANPGIGDEEALARVQLAFGIMFTTRGVPVVYYGDEQGFVGDGGDQAARQDMFPSQVDAYNDDDLIGTDATTGDANFDTGHPVYRTLAELAALRREHGALATGAQITRVSDQNLFVFSRIDRSERVEYLVAANNSGEPRPVAVNTATPGAAFEPLHGSAPGAAADASGEVELTVPPLGITVYRADRPVPAAEAAPGIRITRPADGAEVNLARFRVQAVLDRPALGEVTFAVAADGGELEVIGTDSEPPYSVFWDSTPFPDGAAVEVVATFDDLTGNRAAAESTFTLAPRR